MASVRCWAAQLGGCSDVQSREHLISAGLFTNSTVRVEGFPWCAGQVRNIGLPNLTSKILCERHNNALSKVDQEGQQAFDVLRQVQRLMNVRSSLPARRWTIVRHSIDGATLERWFLKTLINLCNVNGEQGVWSLGGLPAGAPPLPLIQAAFGVAPLAKYLGLYAAAKVGERSLSDDSVGFAPLLRHDGEIAAGLFTFRGWRFLFSAIYERFPEILDLPSAPDPWHGSELRYHLSRFENTHGRYVSQTVDFHWPG